MDASSPRPGSAVPLTRHALDASPAPIGNEYTYFHPASRGEWSFLPLLLLSLPPPLLQQLVRNRRQRAAHAVRQALPLRRNLAQERDVGRQDEDERAEEGVGELAEGLEGVDDGGGRAGEGAKVVPEAGDADGIEAGGRWVSEGRKVKKERESGGQGRVRGTTYEMRFIQYWTSMIAPSFGFDSRRLSQTALTYDAVSKY